MAKRGRPLDRLVERNIRTLRRQRERLEERTPRSVWFADLQINLLAEHEVTRLLSLVDDIAAKLGVESARDPDLEPLKREVAPAKLLERLDDLRQPDA